MLAIEIRLGDLESGKDEEGIFKDALYELAKTAPNSIEANLAEDGQVLEVLDAKLNTITSSVDTLSKEVLGRLDALAKDVSELKTQVGRNQQRDGGQPAAGSEEGAQQSTLAHSSAMNSGAG